MIALKHDHYPHLFSLNMMLRSRCAMPSHYMLMYIAHQTRMSLFLLLSALGFCSINLGALAALSSFFSSIGLYLSML